MASKMYTGDVDDINLAVIKTIMDEVSVKVKEEKERERFTLEKEDFEKMKKVEQTTTTDTTALHATQSTASLSPPNTKEENGTAKEQTGLIPSPVIAPPEQPLSSITTTAIITNVDDDKQTTMTGNASQSTPVTTVDPHEGQQ